MRPLGLSFEVAAPARAHPNRTDIACFVGCVARRSAEAPEGPHRLPELLARWLEGTVGPRVANAGVRDLWLDTQDVATFSRTLRAAYDDPLARLTGPSRATQRTQLEAERTEALASLQSLSATELEALFDASRTLSAVPTPTLDDLRERGFVPGSLLRGDTLAGWLRLQRLTNVPVPLESFEQFDALFAWQARPVAASGDAATATVVTALGAAVRAFFAEGGRRCYVVRTGDPVPLFETTVGRFAGLAAPVAGGAWRRPDASAMSSQTRVPVLPGLAAVMKLGLFASVNATLDPVPSDAARWAGLEHVFGLDDVSFACCPDLVDACAEDLPQSVPPAQVLAIPEAFRECAAVAVPAQEPVGRRLPPPRLDSLGLDIWRACLMHAVRLLANGDRPFHRRDIQLLASLPLAGEGRDMPDPDHWVEWMSDNSWFEDTARKAGGGDVDGSSMVLPALLEARIQLGYPWLRTRDSADCQGGVEAPEGTLCGVLARSALLQGSFRLAAHQRVLRAIDVVPPLDLSRASRGAVTTRIGNVTLADRVCLIAPSARGFELLSDVTCAEDPLLRPGSVRRLVDVVLRAARTLGEEVAFDTNGEALWAQVRLRLSDLGRLLLAAGALSSDAGTRAFVVRCGRDTMTQNDIDAGRLIAEVELVPAQPITRIVVVLALRDARPAGALRRRA